MTFLNSALLPAYSPELKTYLERFPAQSLPSAQDVFYWVKENYGMAPVVSLVHGVVYSPPSRPDRTMVVQKQLYASHYYDASLGLTLLAPDRTAAEAATYVVYLNRSRIDLFDGLFGSVARRIVAGRARVLVADQLKRLQRVLAVEPSAASGKR